MKTVTYTCDCCNKSSRDEMQRLSLISTDDYGEFISDIKIGHLCAKCNSILTSDMVKLFKVVSSKYKSSSVIESENSNHG